MEEKFDRFGCFIGSLIMIAIILIFSAFALFIYDEVKLERYQNIISGEIIKIKPGETVDPAGYVISPGVGLALAEQTSIIVKTEKEIIEVNTNNLKVTINDIGKKATVKEKGKIRNGQKVREELILISIE